MAQEYSGQVTDRVVRDDIAFPADDAEYLALGKHAVLLIAAVTHDPAELPIARVYLEKENGVIQLKRLDRFCATPSPAHRLNVCWVRIGKMPFSCFPCLHIFTQPSCWSISRETGQAFNSYNFQRKSR